LLRFVEISGVQPFNGTYQNGGLFASKLTLGKGWLHQEVKDASNYFLKLDIESFGFILSVDKLQNPYSEKQMCVHLLNHTNSKFQN